MRILIADDHEVIRKVVTKILHTRANVQCIEAVDGLEAVSKALEFRPEVILLDVRMPSLSGFEAATRIREQLPSVPLWANRLCDYKQHRMGLQVGELALCD